MENNIVSKGVVTLTDGKILTMNGVKDIAGFDEEYIILDTGLGRIGVEGKDMKIESLSSDGGDILIKGTINGFFRTENPERKKGIFGKIFG